jgi:nitrate/TMAO reductase-like tetraheme cytochrome c subunit
MDCHDDYHEGQFITPGYKTDCRDCHTVEGFTGSTYTLEKHNEGDFPLTGAHLATPCFACHLQKDKWSFRNIGETCIDCHTDVHEGFLSEKYYPQKSCDRCHSTDQWAQVSFEHQRTGFELSGKHVQIACTDCHKAGTELAPSPTVKFIGLKQECITCHKNIHGRQFELEGVIDCKRCHTYEAWKPGTFDHTTARFALDGAHKKVACKECHKAEVVEGRVTVQYRLERFECIDCHK